MFVIALNKIMSLSSFPTVITQCNSIKTVRF